MKYPLILTMLVAVLYCEAQILPEKFEPSIISNGGVFGLAISPDSKTALWVSSNGKRDTLRIMESKHIHNQWSKPQVVSFSSENGEWKDIDPVFSPDGKMVLFQSNRPVENFPNRKGFDIWAVNKLDEGWSKPYHMGNTINSESSESYASMARNGNIYFMKENEDQIGRSDIYVSEFKEGKYQSPINIGLPINTSERESNPFIGPNEDYLIYFSSDPAGLGEVDLYISFKDASGWSHPRNLGEPVNSEVAEFCPFVHENENRLYFTRQLKQGDRMIENIYSIPFDVNVYQRK